MTPFLKITYFVVTVHFLLVGFCFKDVFFFTKQDIKKPLKIQTFSYQPLQDPQPLKLLASTELKQTTNQGSFPKKSEAKKSNKVNVKPKEKLKKELNTDKKKAFQQTVKKEAICSNRLKEAQKSLAKIEKIQKTNLGAALSFTQESQKGKEVEMFRDVLARELQEALCLPEKGDVKFQLTLNSQGRVIELFILEEKSELNRIYVEKNVPLLSFSPLGKEFSGQLKYTFTITLKGE